jgi:hypothetical protein
MLSIYCVTSTQGFKVDIGGLKWGGGGLIMQNKGNKKITELRTILKRESQNS